MSNIEVAGSSLPFVCEDNNLPAMEAYIQLNLIKRTEPKTRSFYKFFNADNELINNELTRIEWNTLLSSDDVDKCLSEIKISCKRDHDSYISSVEQNVINNPKTFWSYVSELKKDVTVPHVMKLDQAEFNDCDSVSDAFGRYFAGVFEDSDTPVLYESKFDSVLPIFFNYIERSEIVDKIKNLNCSKGLTQIPSLKFSLGRVQKSWQYLCN
ncbi:hypothetical protein HHI36_012805 [Cryptolaemus montrouzieri]|uniref:Uncharacterized protein n=1 Tax=Cryptolaemus montrouzieri TaxID=559131 RepID=A0ABD2NG60_9CUCU